MLCLLFKHYIVYLCMLLYSLLNYITTKTAINYNYNVLYNTNFTAPLPPQTYGCADIPMLLLHIFKTFASCCLA